MDLEKYRRQAEETKTTKDAALAKERADTEAWQRQESERGAAEGESKFKELQQERVGVEQQLETVGTELAAVKKKVEEAVAFAETGAQELDEATRAEFDHDFEQIKAELASLEGRASDLRSRKEALDVNISSAEAAQAVGKALDAAATLEDREADIERKRPEEALRLLSPLADVGELTTFKYARENDLSDPEYQKRFKLTPEQAQAIIDLKRKPELAAAFGKLILDRVTAESVSLNDISKMRELFGRKFDTQAMRPGDETRILGAIGAQQEIIEAKLKKLKMYGEFLRVGLNRADEVNQMLDAVLDANTKLLDSSPDSSQTYGYQAHLAGLLTESQQFDRAKKILDTMEEKARSEKYFFPIDNSGERVKTRSEAMSDPARKPIKDAIDRARQKIREAEVEARRSTRK